MIDDAIGYVSDFSFFVTLIMVGNQFMDIMEVGPMVNNGGVKGSEAGQKCVFLDVSQEVGS